MADSGENRFHFDVMWLKENESVGEGRSGKFRHIYLPMFCQAVSMQSDLIEFVHGFRCHIILPAIMATYNRHILNDDQLAPLAEGSRPAYQFGRLLTADVTYQLNHYCSRDGFVFRA